MRIPKLLVFCLLLTSLLGSGCMDILKEIYFNKDGSGQARIEYSLEGLLETMEEMGGGDMGGMNISKSEDGKIEFPSFTEFVDQLKGMPGISKVKYSEDSEASKVAVSFAFADLAAYNRAEEASGSTSGEVISSEEAADMLLSRSANKLTTSADMKMSKAKGKEGKMMKEMLLVALEGYTYTMKYTFEEKVEKVKKNKNAEISADRKTVTVAADMADLLNGASKISNQIILE